MEMTQAMADWGAGAARAHGAAREGHWAAGVAQAIWAPWRARQNEGVWVSAPGSSAPQTRFEAHGEAPPGASLNLGGYKERLLESRLRRETQASDAASAAKNAASPRHRR
jgi:hypothetical protein